MVVKDLTNKTEEDVKGKPSRTLRLQGGNDLDFLGRSIEEIHQNAHDGGQRGECTGICEKKKPFPRERRDRRNSFRSEENSGEGRKKTFASGP